MENPIILFNYIKLSIIQYVIVLHINYSNIIVLISYINYNPIILQYYTHLLYSFNCTPWLGGTPFEEPSTTPVSPHDGHEDWCTKDLVCNLTPDKQHTAVVSAVSWHWHIQRHWRHCISYAQLCFGGSSCNPVQKQAVLSLQQVRSCQWWRKAPA